MQFSRAKYQLEEAEEIFEEEIIEILKENLVSYLLGLLLSYILTIFRGRTLFLNCHVEEIHIYNFLYFGFHSLVPLGI